MADVLMHYVISYLMIRRIFNWRVSLVISLIALLPDVDVLFRIHRWFTHSVIVLSILLLCLTISLTLFKRYRRYLLYLGVAVMVYLLHLVIDLFTASTPILWPLTIESYSLRMLIQGRVAKDSTISIYPILKVNTSLSDFTPRDSLEGPLATDLSIVLAVATLILELTEFVTRNRRNLLKS